MKIHKYVLILILTTALLFSQDFNGLKFCIDPGHGGHESDDRHMLATDFWESEGNLTKAFHVKYILESHGAEVVLTRDGNDDPPPTEDYGTEDDPTLYQRSEIANNNNVDFFQSIHSNGWNGTNNSTLMLFRGYDDDPVWDEAKEMSDIMAVDLYTANRTTHYSVRGDWDFYDWGTSGLGVLRHLNMPGVLSEGSFHDYVPESWRLQNLDYRKKEAWAIANSFQNYYNTDNYNYKMIAGLVRDRYESVDYYFISSLGDYYKPINNVTVILVSGQSGDSLIYSCDEMNNGFFTFDSLISGDYEVIVEADEYYSDTASVTISDNLFNFQDFRLVSKIPPVVESTIPAEGDTAFPAWDPLKIEFSRSMDTLSTVEQIIFDPSTTFSTIWQKNNTILWIIPDSLNYLTDYTFTLTGNIQDAYGHFLDGNGDNSEGDSFDLHFKTTRRDIEPPEITLAFPKMGANQVELHPLININYGEEVTDSSITEEKIKLEDFTNGQFLPVTLLHYVKNDKSSVCIFPDEELNRDNVYITRISSGITDMYNNSTSLKRSYSFQTGSKIWDITNIDNFENGVDNWWPPGSSGSTVGIVENLTGREANTDTTNILTNSAKSLEIYYKWNTNSDSWLLREYLSGGSPRNVTFDKNYIMQAYVFGDASRNKIRFAVDDKHPNAAASNHEVSPWFVIDWVGWKLISWDMANEQAGEWLGDGNLDGTLRFDSIQLTHNSNDPEAIVQGMVLIEDLRIVKEINLGVEPELDNLPDQVKLYQNYPNPFNPSTTITFLLSEPGKADITIYNIKGEEIRSFSFHKSLPGRHSFIWDGKDGKGARVATGTYIYKLQFKNKSSIKKMLMIK